MRAESAGGGKWKKRWIASWIAVAVVNALDIHSSLGHGEANPLYRSPAGRFAPGREILIKSAIAGGFFGFQLAVVRGHPEKDYYKTFALANTVAAGGLAGVAAHNYSLPAQKAGQARMGLFSITASGFEMNSSAASAGESLSPTVR